MRLPLSRGAAVAATAIATSITLSTVAAAPALAAPGTTTQASSPAANLVTALTFAGTEHAYLAGSLVDTSVTYGETSLQALAVAKGLRANVDTLATLLVPKGGSARTQLAAALLARDSAALRFGEATGLANGPTAADKQAGARAQADAKAAGQKAAQTLARLAVARFPTVTTAAVAKSLTALDSDALATAGAFGRAGADRFARAYRDSALTGAYFATLGVVEVKTDGLKGDLTSNDALYRVALTVAFAQHVYQTGLAGGSALKTGLTSGETRAALRTLDTNSKAIAILLGRSVGRAGEDLGAWRLHINGGYGNIIEGLRERSAVKTSKGEAALRTYIARITRDVEALAPAVPASVISKAYTMHSFGTETVLDRFASSAPAEQAQGYALAVQGAHSFASQSGLASVIAVGAAKSGKVPDLGLSQARALGLG